MTISGGFTTANIFTGNLIVSNIFAGTTQVNRLNAESLSSNSLSVGGNILVANIYTGTIAASNNATFGKSLSAGNVSAGNLSVANTATIGEYIAATDVYSTRVSASSLGLVSGESTNMIQLGGASGDLNVAGLGKFGSVTRYNAKVGESHMFFSGGIRVANISTAGNLTITGDTATKSAGTTWSVASDQRLKSNIVNANLEMCASIVSNLSLRRFELWSKSQLGFVAQEIETVLPEAVSIENAFGLDDCRVLNADQIIMNLVGALQNALKRIEALELK
jgi:hypothetical protein